MKLIDEKEMQEAKEWVQLQINEINPDTKGIVIFTYGTENYMVSGQAARVVFESVEPELKKQYPNYIFLFLPFFIKLEKVLELEGYNDES